MLHPYCYYRSMRSFTIPCLSYQLKVDWYEGADDQRILLVLIGWTSNKARYEDLTSAIVANTGMNALVFEYSGHGDSQLDPYQIRPAQHFLEVITVLDWLKDKYPEADISVMGSSYGGYMAVHLAQYRDFHSLVLRAPAIYMPSDFYAKNADINRPLVDTIYRKDASALAVHPLITAKRVFHKKTLLVVHELDDVVPAETTDAYAQTFDAEVHIARGMPHSIGGAPRADIRSYQNAISTWLNEN